MEKFRYFDDVEAWLAPMNYEEFWAAIKPHCLILEYRSVCDAKIETGQVAQGVILYDSKPWPGANWAGGTSWHDGRQRRGCGS